MSFRLSPIGVGLGLEPRKTQPMGATINLYGGVVSCALIHTTFAIRPIWMEGGKRKSE